MVVQNWSKTYCKYSGIQAVYFRKHMHTFFCLFLFSAVLPPVTCPLHEWKNPLAEVPKKGQIDIFVGYLVT